MEKMMKRFKAGDKVQRTARSWGPGGIHQGSIYTVVAEVDGKLFLEELGGGRSADPAAFTLWKDVQPVPAPKAPMILTADPAERKAMPITSGVLGYFPLAIAEVAKVSKAGNDQHNPGQPLHWARGKSTDHHDCIARHLIDKGTFDTDGMRHSAKLAWRALAALQVELEQEKGLYLDAV